jgi:NAD-dependent dihydropyrimidine dehydrogenase PreA subunit
MSLHYLKNVATLSMNQTKCNGCGICIQVCPRNVFAQQNGQVIIREVDACMECGACSLNCPFEALQVRSGVGCAYALLRAKLRGGEPSCGCSDSTAQ